MPLFTTNRQKFIIIVALVVSLPSLALLRGVKNSNYSLVRAHKLAPADSSGERRQIREGYRPRLKRDHQVAVAATAAIDSRGLPSALPKHRRKSPAQQQQQASSPGSNNGTMRTDKSLSKRLASSQVSSTLETQRKRFKTSGRFAATSSESNSFESNHRHSDLLRKNNNTLIEGHLNRVTSTTTSTISSNQQDLNNNSIDSEPQRSNWRQNINSVNGTVDLSQYNQADVDRLYGDALLVYFKNFNETLPARRETLNINGTSPDKTPIYRSVSSSNK